MRLLLLQFAQCRRCGQLDAECQQHQAECQQHQEDLQAARDTERELRTELSSTERELRTTERRLLSALLLEKARSSNNLLKKQVLAVVYHM